MQCVRHQKECALLSDIIQGLIIYFVVHMNIFLSKKEVEQYLDCGPKPRGITSPTLGRQFDHLWGNRNFKNITKPDPDNTIKCQGNHAWKQQPRKRACTESQILIPGYIQTETDSRKKNERSIQNGQYGGRAPL